MNDYSTLRVELDGAVRVVTIDRPDNELNAVDEHVHTDLSRLFRELREEREARAVLITGSKRAFSAGGDFSWFPELRSIERLEELRRDARSMILDLLDVPVPVVAALNGPAVGLGASIALLCDAIVMGESTVIADPHVRVGLVAGDGGTAIWPLALGPAMAKRHLLTGEPIGAERAFQLGLVTDVAADDAVFVTALALARRLASQPPLAVRYTKLAVNKLVRNAVEIAFDVAMHAELVTFLSADHAEALDAIAQHRSPAFRGR